MAKDVWIRANVKGCAVAAGRIELMVNCGNFEAVGETVFTWPSDMKKLAKTLCYVKGMINSSQNALVKTADSWGPLGRLSSRFDYRHGVSVYKIINEFSRDGDIECVMNREDAEKLCLLSQTFYGTPLTLLEIAQKNGLHPDRLTAKGLKTFETAIQNKISKFVIDARDLAIDERVAVIVVAGR